MRGRRSWTPSGSFLDRARLPPQRMKMMKLATAAAIPEVNPKRKDATGGNGSRLTMRSFGFGDDVAADLKRSSISILNLDIARSSACKCRRRW
jgi:hypothetical protein